MTLGELAASHPSAVPALERYRLDYCCHGRRTLEQACHERGIDPAVVLTEIDRSDARSTTSAEHRWDQASMSELADHIEQTHHAHAREMLAAIGSMAQRVADKHGRQHRRLIELLEVVRTLTDGMHDHMIREERVLFPWLRRLERQTEIQVGPPWSVSRPISCMEHDHEEVGAMLERIRALTDDFCPPDQACRSWRGLYELLRVLELDTHAHIHKENSILFPAGIRAERQKQVRAAP